MKTLNTETTHTGIWKGDEWELIPFNTEALVVSPPEIFSDFEPVMAQFPTRIGDIVLCGPSIDYSIDQYTHETLTETSLQEFGEIWRTLASL